jgi:hypothetical protein
MYLYNDSGSNRVVLDGDSSGGGSLYLYDASGSSGFRAAAVNGGYLYLYNDSGSSRVFLDGDSAGGGLMYLYDYSGSSAVGMYGSYGGQISLYNDVGSQKVFIDGDDNDATSGGGGLIQLRNGSGTATITIDADYAGDGRIITQELQITGGSDLSENFDLAPTDLLVEPGMILSIDPQRPGQLALSTEPYDHKVAGIISGADGVKPGLIMGQEGTIADGAYPVAITGRVYCLADATEHAIEPGDLLTTSAVPGHAMKVTDHTRAWGAIIGKAMTALDSGQGKVLVLVSLR